jgi:hypothetical protein
MWQTLLIEATALISCQGLRKQLLKDMIVMRIEI